jgi:predicted  nucleic acid-binding Zn-ribbon protein
VADLTADGACGYCFSMMPLQVQNQVRHGTDIVRCEACGVILTAPEPAGDQG